MSSNATTTVPNLRFNDDNSIPQLGFGVFQIPPEDTAEAVQHALKTGYRLVDTAAAYNNEQGVGEGLARSGLDRGEVFVTTKLWNDDQGHSEALRAFDRSLDRLGFEYVDLYLIHWPAPARGRYVETWQALCELKREGRARSIGVSNFMVEHLEAIIDATGVVPALNQIELHPRFQQRELRAFHSEHDILTEAWSPLGQGSALDDRSIKEIASNHDRSPAQIVLRWHLQLGNVVIPKSATPGRIEQNFSILDFELSDEEMGVLAQLDTSERIGPNPATFS
jgi:2,5-diketo-D-gluconate reductase A